MGGLFLRVGLVSAAVLLGVPAFAGSSAQHSAKAQNQSATPSDSGMSDAAPDYGSDGSVINPDGDDSGSYSQDDGSGYGDDQDDGGDDDDGLPPTNQI